MEWLIGIIFILLIVIFFLWRERGHIKQQVHKEAELLFNEWTTKELPALRKKAVAGSQASTLGKSLEQIAPYFPDFPYNPKDVRFLGTPIDLVVFDGISEGDLKEVVFIEVKTGAKPRLPANEKQLKECIQQRRVGWELLHLKTD